MRKASSRLRAGLALSLAAVISGSVLGATPSSAAPDPNPSPGGRSAALTQNAFAGQQYSQFIVQFKDRAASDAAARARAVTPAAQRAGTSAAEVRGLATGATLIALGRALSDVEARSFMKDLAATGVVDYVEPDALMKATLTPDDPRYGEQWDFTGANGMRIPGAWDTSTGNGAVVAVLDTGITSHPDLNANVVGGYDFVSDATAARDGNGRDANPQDEGDWYAAGECGQTKAANSSWHGTHVAGTVAAVTGNATGVAGVAPNAKVVPVRVLAKCGGLLSDIADAIVWASGGAVTGIPANPNPARVINMSLGGAGTCGTTYQNAINAAVNRGTTMVVAAGNESQNAANSRPANCSNVVAVGASDPNGGLSYYSNYGSTVDLTAPGGDVRTAGGGILSTLNTGTTTPAAAGYAFYQGTSMATPHVAGLAALMTAAKPALTPSQVESTLKQGTRPMPAGCSLGCGAGLSDATATMALVAGGSTPPPSGNLLLNPGFESGGTSWTANYADTFATGTEARTGSGFAYLNGWGRSMTYTLDQRVSVPTGTGAAPLSFYLKVLSDESTSYAYDTLKVQVVDGTTTSTLATYSNKDKGTAYVQRSVDLSAFKGKTVTVRFLGTEDSSVQTSFYVDDTSLTVG
jgi:serine protease